MVRKFIRITLQTLCALLCLLLTFIFFTLVFGGKDLTTLQNHPSRGYPQHVYHALISAEDPKFSDSFLRRNTCIITEKRCDYTLRHWALGHLTTDERPDLRRLSHTLHYTIALPRANLTVKPRQFLDYALDTSYYGNGATGISAAAHIHFDTTSDALTIAQAAQLAALLRSPSIYSGDRNQWANRTRSVLKTMQAKAFITDAQYTAALNAL